jgi:hypothetical protein
MHLVRILGREVPHDLYRAIVQDVPILREEELLRTAEGHVQVLLGVLGPLIAPNANW